MEQQPNMMEKGKVKKGNMEMPMTGGPSLGLLVLPAPALLVPIHLHRIAERNCLENSWTGLDRVFLAAKNSEKAVPAGRLQTREAPDWGLFGIIKQFQRDCSRKLSFRRLKFSESRSAPVL
jgi:hypothetical protein